MYALKKKKRKAGLQPLTLDKFKIEREKKKRNKIRKKKEMNETLKYKSKEYK